MPEFSCPRCHTKLREEDCHVQESPSWQRNMLLVVLHCWVCTWQTEWIAANMIEEEVTA